MNDIGSLPAASEDIGQQNHERGHRCEIAFPLVDDLRSVVDHNLLEMDLGNHSLDCRDPGCRGLGYQLLGTAHSLEAVRSFEAARNPEIAHSSEEDLGFRSLSLHSPGCHGPETGYIPGAAHSLEKGLGYHIPDFRSSDFHGLEIVHSLDFHTGLVLETETDYSRNLVHGTADSVRCEIAIENHAYHHRLSCSKRSRRARRPS